MKNYAQYFLACLIITFVSLQSCTKDDPIPDKIEEPEDKGPDEYKEVNDWIWDYMRDFYYWNSEFTISADTPAFREEPESYFYSLLSGNDRFSYISNNTEGKSASGELEFTIGYHPIFYTIGGGNVMIWVAYTYPGSNAEKQGLKRGDIILEIDDIQLNETNWQELFSRTSYTATLGDFRYENFQTIVYPTNQTIELYSENTNTDPLIYTSTIDYDNKKIGYMVYTQYYDGANGEFITSIDTAMSSFEQANIDEFILDLRYNPGGFVSVAGYLTSCLAPKQVVDNKSLLIKKEFNSIYQKYLENTSGGDTVINYNFPGSKYNLDLDRIYILTDFNSASASELTIVGLEPYMDVIHIGDTTVGKYVGSFEFNSKETGEDNNFDWTMNPITFKFINSLGFSDFEKGLAPDHFKPEPADNVYPLGDVNEYLLNYTLQLISGGAPALFKKKAAPLTPDLPLKKMPYNNGFLIDNTFKPELENK